MAHIARQQRRPQPQIKPQNIGSIDRFFRALLGFGLLSMMLFATDPEGNLMGISADTMPHVWFTLASIYPALTAILGWDPFYQASNVRSETRLGGDVSGPLIEQLNALHHASEIEKKQAQSTS